MHAGNWSGRLMPVLLLTAAPPLPSASIHDATALGVSVVGLITIVQVALSTGQARTKRHRFLRQAVSTQ